MAATRYVGADYDEAVARRIAVARHRKADRLAERAAIHLRNVGATSEDLSRLDDAGWATLARLAGTRQPSPVTRALVCDYVRRFHGIT